MSKKTENNVQINNDNSIDKENQNKLENKNKSEKLTKIEKEYNFVSEIKKDMVEVKIPIDPMNKHLKTEDVFINGYRWTIEKGKTVKVPRAVKDVLENAGII